jgi:hypothetical protein
LKKAFKKTLCAKNTKQPDSKKFNIINLYRKKEAQLRRFENLQIKRFLAKL